MAWVRPAAAASRVGEVGAVCVRILSSGVLPLGRPESFLLIAQEPHPPRERGRAAYHTVGPSCTGLRGGGPALAWTYPDIAFVPENKPEFC